jgi:hypothetical protein
MGGHLSSEKVTLDDHFELVEKFEVENKVPQQVITQAIIAIAAGIRIYWPFKNSGYLRPRYSNDFLTSR